MPLDYLSFGVLLASIGMVLFLAEYFFPTGGIFLIAGLLLCVTAVFVISYYGQTEEAAAAIVALCVGVPLIGTGMVYFWGKQMALTVSPEENADGVLPGVSELEALKGRVGRTESPMRPSGAVDFDGRRVDAMTEGLMLDAGVWVRCIDAKGGKIIVRQIPKPPDLQEMDFDGIK